MLSTRQALDAKTVKTEEGNAQGFSRDKITDFIAADPEDRADRSERHLAHDTRDAAKELDAARRRIEEALHSMMAAEAKAKAASKESVARAKDAANQLGDALNRVTRMLGPDFESRLAQLERLSGALVTLAELEKTGNLRGILAALDRK